MVSFVLFVILIAFVFDFINGFHDAANSIATIVGTRVLSPLTAVVWAAFFNFVALFIFGTPVAKTIGTGLVDLAIVNQNVILAGLLGAIAWNLITWWYGIPSSSSHALIGGYAGAAIAKAGFGAVLYNGWTLTLLFIVLSPMIGMLLGFALMTGVFWTLRNARPARVDRWFRTLQLASAAAFSLSHGANDAQKTMGIIMSLLIASSALFQNETGLLAQLYVTADSPIPWWVKFGAHFAIALGTLLGGWRIVRTMGSRVTKLRPVGGFCAETGGAVSILFATFLGIPVSTTHTITGAIVGVGATTRLSAVRWGLARRIVWAWVLTIPASAALAALAFALVGGWQPA